MQNGTSSATIDNEVPGTSKESNLNLQPPTPLEIAKDPKLESMYTKMCLENETIRVQKIFQVILELANTQNDNQWMKIFRHVVEHSGTNRSAQLIPLPKDLRIKMVSGIMKGRISDTTVQEVIDTLSPYLNESVNSFWSLMQQEERQQEEESVGTKDSLKIDQFYQVIISKIIAKQWRCINANSNLPGNLEFNLRVKMLFKNVLNSSSEAHMNEEISQFARFLEKQKDVDRRPLLKNNLLFYIEVQKFRNAQHSKPDKMLLKKKAFAIVNCFLNSYMEPRLQIEVDSQKLERALRTSGLYLKGSAIFGDMFDEVQDQVFIELLPYWIMFQQTWEPWKMLSNRSIPAQANVKKKGDVERKANIGLCSSD